MIYPIDLRQAISFLSFRLGLPDMDKGVRIKLEALSSLVKIYHTQELIFKSESFLFLYIIPRNVIVPCETEDCTYLLHLSKGNPEPNTPLPACNKCAGRSALDPTAIGCRSKPCSRGILLETILTDEELDLLQLREETTIYWTVDLISPVISYGASPSDSSSR